MKRILVLLFAAALALGLLGCSKAEDKSPGDSGQVQVNYEEDAYDLMGMYYETFLEQYGEEMIENSSDGAQNGEAYYQLKNGVEVGIPDGQVYWVRTFYHIEAEYPVPLLKGIGGEDRYDDVLAKLGTPYYASPELMGEEEKEFDTAVFYLGKYQYLKVYCDGETGYVSHIACFHDAAPIFEEIDGVKLGDSLGDLKAAYEKLYYSEPNYDPAQGGPNRVYYTPMEEGDRGVECLEFHLYDKKIINITTMVRDVLGWKNYEDIFGMENVFKEISPGKKAQSSDEPVQGSGESGADVVYFYDDAEGKEQVLLKVENCSTSELDLDSDGVTEVIASKAGRLKAIDIYDYDVNTGTVIRLDVCQTLDALWSDYFIKSTSGESTGYVMAGFDETANAEGIKVYSIKDNVLTYVGTYSQVMP